MTDAGRRETSRCTPHESEKVRLKSHENNITIMQPDKFTLKAQEAMQNAHAIATEYDHQYIDCEHLLLALLREEDGLAPRILAKMDISPVVLLEQLERHLSEQPQVSGITEIHITQRFNSALIAAEKEAKRLKDDYISVEHLLIALIESDGACARIRTARCSQGGSGKSSGNITIAGIDLRGAPAVRN